MDCGENRFCRSLTEGDRARMCAGCTLRPHKKGQVVYREDIASYIVVVVDGVMTTQTDFTDGMLAEGDCPCFFINTSGLVLGVDGLFNEKPIERYRYIHYTCLTDCTIARFDPALVRTLFEQSPAFAKALYLNVATAAGEACEFAAVLRANNVEQADSAADGRHHRAQPRLGGPGPVVHRAAFPRRARTLHPDARRVGPRKICITVIIFPASPQARTL